MPENDAVLLPEPFSEKNIDGSPISRSDEGRSLFRNPARKDRRVAERRGNDRRSGGDRRSPEDDYGFGPTQPEPRGYEAAGPYRPEPPVYQAPEPRRPEPPVYETPEPRRPEPPAYETPETRRPEPPIYDAPPMPEPQAARYDEPAGEAGHSDYGQAFMGQPVNESFYDTDRFEPPVDEKPGMIPNPMKMPPVKKKSSLEYDLDSDYGGYGEENVASTETGATEPAGDDDGYGYDFGNDAGSSRSNDDGYGYDFDDESPVKERASSTDGDSDYGYYGEADDAGSDSSFGNDAGAGGYDDYGSGGYGSGDYDSDYGSDYESGSDLSSDYY